MIRGYSDHAANERTFLAWVRTGIAVIAFGFVIEKFNLFVLTIASSTSAEVARRLQLERLSGPRRARTYRGRNRALRPHRAITRRP
jgi:putative membrane protein